MSAPPAVVAIDVGGTTTKTAIVGPTGVAAAQRMPSRRDGGPDAFAGDLVATARSLVDRCAELGVAPVALGVAVLGIVDEVHGVGRYSATVGWRDVPIPSLLEDATGRPVAVGHDVRAGGLAEATFGAATALGSALFVPLGTGLAAAVIVGGEVLPGATYQAGELGQLLVADPPTGSPEPGQRVRLETVCSARAIGERYARAAGEAPGRVGADDVVELVAAGDQLAARIWAEAIDALGHSLAAAVATVDPEAIVIGGGLGRAGSALAAPLTGALAELLPWRRPPAILSAGFGDDAGVVGAALLGWRRARRDVAELADVLRPERWNRAGAPAR